jgi:exosortase A-associated hydrolase 1
MNYRETALQFACEGETLLAIVASPPSDQVPADVGVVVIVGGPQYRAGSHRQFVLLARFLATAGYLVLRFDYRGMGDSSGRQRDFQDITPDIGASIKALQTHDGRVKKVVLWGLCDAASAALMYAQTTQDARLAGLCLLNPWVRSEASLARTHVKHYYAQRFLQKTFWQKLLSGRIGSTALLGLASNIKKSITSDTAPQLAASSYQDRMAQGWRDFNGQILLVLSGADLTAKEFLECVATAPAWRGALSLSHVARHDLPSADHTFSDRLALEQLQTATGAWLNKLARRNH